VLDVPDRGPRSRTGTGEWRRGARARLLRPKRSKFNLPDATTVSSDRPGRAFALYTAPVGNVLTDLEARPKCLIPRCAIANRAGAPRAGSAQPGTTRRERGCSIEIVAAGVRA